MVSFKKQNAVERRRHIRTQAERRRYFRIEADVFFLFRTIDKVEQTKLEHRIKRGEPLCPDQYYSFLQLETEISDFIHKLKDKEPELSAAMDLLNRKINLISKGPPTEKSEYSVFDCDIETINLSGCGLACMSPEAIEEGAYVELQLVLLPEKCYICCLGRVVNCRDVALSANHPHSAEKPFRIGVNFESIRPEDSEKIIQHVIKREVDALRENKRHLKDETKRHLK